MRLVEFTDGENRVFINPENVVWVKEYYPTDAGDRRIQIICNNSDYGVIVLGTIDNAVEKLAPVQRTDISYKRG